MGWTTSYASRPPFIGDNHSMTLLPTGRQIDWSYIPESYRDGAQIVKLAAAALADATSITVDALSVGIPTGTTLYFGESKEFALTTAPAAAGATSISVQALPSALEDDDEAVIPGSGSAKVIPAGTVMCVIAATGKMVPRANRPGAETAVGLLASAAREGDRAAALSGYGVYIGGAVYENLLPETITSYKTELQTAGVGTGFAWFTYADDTGS